MRFRLGIDQHASQLTVSLRSDEGDVAVRKQVCTKPDKILKFFEMIAGMCLQHNCSFWAIVEICGFNDWLIEMLRNYRCQRIEVIQPKDSSRKKSDRRDAAKQDTDAAILMRTPGIAPFSAVAMSCRIAGITRFKRPRALANYLGLTPGCRSCGKKERIGKITKAGSCMCRWILGLATIIWHMLTKRKTYHEVHSLGIGLQQ